MDSKVADDVFRIVPADAMPPGRNVVHVDIDGQPRWLLREGTPMPDLVAELNQLSTHLIRHGIWQQQRDDETPPRLRHVS